MRKIKITYFAFMKKFLGSVIKISLGVIFGFLGILLCLKLLFSPIVKIDDKRVILLGGLIDVSA